MKSHVCKCDGCARLRRFEDLRPGMTAESASFVEKILSELENTQSDLGFHQAVADGSWPNAEDILEGWLQNARKAASDREQEHECPNCVTPWKCNGPHVGEAPKHRYGDNDNG